MKRREMKALRDYISHESDISKQLDTDITFWKIQLMPQWAQRICWYGAFQQYSAGRHEQAVRSNPKVGWNASNHNLN